MLYYNRRKNKNANQFNWRRISYLLKLTSPHHKKVLEGNNYKEMFLTEETYLQKT